MAQIIVDTGLLVALLDRSEQHHRWAGEQLRKVEGPLLTCDAVLAETCFLLANFPVALKYLRHYLREKFIVPAFQSHPHGERIFNLMDTYQHVPMSFADACLVCLVEEHPGAVLFTLDADFTIYRQQRRRIIRLIAPF